jgi:voltage-gated potassium channel
MARANIDEVLAGIPIFSKCNKKELRAITRLLSSLRVSAGEVLTTQGDHGREFMIIESGTAVVRRNDRKVATMGPGDFFGELAMLAGVTRTATVVAQTEMVIDVLSPREFASLLADNPAIASKIYLTAIRRLYEDNQRGLQ